MRQKALFLVIVLLVLVACSKDGDEAKENGSKEHAIEDKETKKEEMKDVYPLTGIGTNKGADNRIISVMVNNHRQARPQSGLSQADIVFEILAEGDITRFLALFQSEKPDVVGPVRSAREYYFTLADGYNAIYVYHGAADFVNEMIGQRGIEHLNGSIYDNDGRLFKREPFRKAPHNSYLQYDVVDEVAADKGYDTTMTTDGMLPFINDDESIAGDNVNHLEVAYVGEDPSHLVEYVYNDQNETYTRYEDDEQTVELNTSAPIQVDNVFIVETYHEVFDEAGRRKVDLESGGKAYLFQKGKFQEVEWQNEDGKIIPMKHGQAIGFVPGKTWINVVPTNPGIEQSVHIYRD